jgi:prevent-host-death family protein
MTPGWYLKNLRKCPILDDHLKVVKTIAQAKAQFCEIVALAGKGKSTTITRHNQPVARVVPVQGDARRLTEQWRQQVQGIRLNRKDRPKRTISRLIQEGRK